LFSFNHDKISLILSNRGLDIINKGKNIIKDSIHTNYNNIKENIDQNIQNKKKKYRGEIIRCLSICFI